MTNDLASEPAAIPPAEPAPARRVVKVTRAMVASARAQVEIAELLGETVPPAIQKIAKVPM